MTSIESEAVTIIVVAYEDRGQLRSCLDAIGRLNGPRPAVIVVDNGTSTGDQNVVPPGPLVIRPGSNTGFAAACNRAARQATSEWIALLNPDAYPEPDWLMRLLEAARLHPGADAFGSTQLDAHDPTRLDGAGDAYFAAGQPYRALHKRPVSMLPPGGEVFGPCAAAALWRRERYLALGGFEERFFCYGEDVDLAYRHRLRGGRCMQVPSAVVRHEGSGISGRRSDFTTYHGHRNRVWTYLRDTPPLLLVATFPLHIAFNVGLLPLMAARSQTRPYLRALLDAMKGAGPFLQERKQLHRTATGWRPIAKALTWSPWAMLRRRPKTW